jgi:hypothetical protein
LLHHSACGNSGSGSGSSDDSQTSLGNKEIEIPYIASDNVGKIPDAWNESEFSDTVAYNGPLAVTGVVVTS